MPDPDLPVILIIGGEPATILSLAGGLGPDFAVRLAPGVPAALDMIRAEPPDLILLDVMATDGGGHEHCATIKADVTTAGIPVICITASDRAEDDLRCIAAGAVDYVAMPVNMPQIKARIRVHLEQRRNEEDLRRANDRLELRVAERTREFFEANRALVAEAKAHKRAKDAILFSHDRLAALARLSQMRDLSPEALIEFALEEAVRLTKSGIGYFHFVKDDEQTIVLNKWSKNVSAACSSSASTHYNVSLAGIWADCIRRREPITHNNYDLSPDKKGLPEGHVPVTRHLGVPIFDGDKIAAVAGVGNKAEPYDDSDTHQLHLFMDQTYSILKQRQDGEALAKALDAAEAASRIKTEFLTMMSHEIRTPLNGILGMAELLRLSALDAEQTEYLGHLRASAEGLRGLLDDILEYVKLEFGDGDAASVPVDPEALVQATMADFTAKAKAKGLELTAQTAPGLPRLALGDVSALHKALGHLVDNAIKFTPQGSVTVRLDRLEGDPTGNGSKVWLRFSVADTGQGIAAGDMERIFDLFTQGDSSITRKHGGIGLGLAIASKIAEKLGGRIEVISSLGKGSEFSLIAPLTAA